MIRAQGNLVNIPDVTKPTARRMTGSTAVTASSAELTEVSSDDFTLNDEDSPVKGEGDGLVMNLIKKEMVQSLTRVAAARMRQQSGEKESSMKETEEAIRKLATMVLDGEDEANNSGKSESMKPDKDLRDLLRQALVVGENEDAAADSTEASLKDGALDIWNPDYWVAGEESLHGRSELSNSMHTGVSTSASRSSGVHTESDESGASQSLQDFLANLKEISSDSDVSDDDCSVLSDITGLTEFFPEDEERKVTAKAVRSKVLLESVPSMKNFSAKNNRKLNSKVSFGQVCVRKYQRIICDNPAVTAGPSIGVGWKYKVQVPVSVDAYETSRGERKQHNALMLDRVTREKMARRMGYTERQIADMTRAVNKTKNQRRQTLNNLGVEKMELAVETAKRRLKSFLFLKGKEVKTNY